MFTYLFYKTYFLCLLFFCCALCVPVYSFNSDMRGTLNEVNEVQLFKEDEIKIEENHDCTQTTSHEITVSNIKKYFSGGFMTALLSGDICDCDKKEKGDLLAKYFEANGAVNLGKEAFDNLKNNTKWQKHSWRQRLQKMIKRLLKNEGLTWL